MCDTGGLDSMYAFTAANVRFGSANAFYHSNTTHSTPFEGASYDRPPLSASLKNVMYTVIRSPGTVPVSNRESQSRYQDSARLLGESC